MTDEIRIRLTGTQPLLLHHDNIQWADEMEEWKNDPRNAGQSKAGDDRTPPWRWIGCLTYDKPDGVVAIAQDCLMAACKQGASQIKMGGSNSKKTFKSASQSGMVLKQEFWPLLVEGKTISMPAVMKLAERREQDHKFVNLVSFREQMEAAEKMGFSLFVKRAPVGRSKHVRVRPRFDNWSVEGDIVILDPEITKEKVLEFFRIAGRTKGIGDWRPGAPSSPGPFGTFTAELV